MESDIFSLERWREAVTVSFAQFAEQVAIYLPQLLAGIAIFLLGWEPSTPPQRKSLAESGQAIADFMAGHDAWVIEGCYADLIELVLPRVTEIIFLDLSVEDCISNARKRPWEPHKYASKDAQDANLPMLLDWIAQYDKREDTFSRAAHERLFNDYAGRKTRYTDNDSRRGADEV